jgi:hypothetical protein
MGANMTADELSERILAGDKDAARLVLAALWAVGGGSLSKGLRTTCGLILPAKIPMPCHLKPWAAAACHWAAQAKRSVDAAQRPPWLRWAIVKNKCLELRAKDTIERQRPGKTWAGVYATATWQACGDRMLMQAMQGVYRGRSNPWVRWAHNTAKNINRRGAGRYAKAVAEHDQVS